MRKDNSSHRHSNRILGATRRIPEIEYLRAVAVTVVILYHLEVNSSGFAGVDIFFVISGFVISRSIYEMGQGCFFATLLEFYYRRIIRILPPLILVSLVSLAFGWTLFFDADLSQLQETLTYQAFFVQNVFFVETVANYFKGIASSKLTLHTWSLAVEEQFYIFFPYFFILITRHISRHKAFLIPLILIITTISVYFSLYNSNGLTTLTSNFTKYLIDSNINLDAMRFYSITFRAWEFLLGVCTFCIYIQSEQTFFNKYFAGFLSKFVHTFCILVLFGISFLPLHEITWPNSQTLGICALTSLCLVLGVCIGSQHKQLNRIEEVICYVGRTSYSSYLWHWPLIGILTYFTFSFGDQYIDYAIFFLALAVSVFFTYECIEKRRFRISTKASFFLLIGFIGGMYFLGQVERSLSMFTTVKQNIFTTSQYDSSHCPREVVEQGNDFIVLYGDSHSQMISSEFQNVSEEAGFDVVCVRGGLSEREVHETFTKLVSLRNYAGSFFAMRWNMYAVGFQDYEVEEEGARYLPWNGNSPNDGTEAFVFFEKNFETLLAILEEPIRPRPLGIMLQVPTMPFFPHKEMLVDYHNLRFRPLPKKLEISHRREHSKVNRYFNDISRIRSYVQIFDPARVLCHMDMCRYREGWNSLYKDDDHLSVYGETLLKPMFQKWVAMVARQAESYAQKS